MSVLHLPLSLSLSLLSFSRGSPLISLLALTLIYGPWPPTWKTHSRERASFSACSRTWRRYLSTRLNPSRRGGGGGGDATTYADVHRVTSRSVPIIAEIRFDGLSINRLLHTPRISRARGVLFTLAIRTYWRLLLRAPHTEIPKSVFPRDSSRTKYFYARYSGLFFCLHCYCKILINKILWKV